MITLARGVPSTDLLPARQLADAARAALDEDPEGALLYGDAAGYAPLRDWFGEQLAVDPARIVLTNGSLQGLALVAAHFVRSGRHVMLEAPSYDFAVRLFQRAGAELSLVSVEPDGLDLAELEAHLRSHGPSLLYTIPTFHNPTGVTLSNEKRHALLELARRWDLLVVEDDPYRRLEIESEAPPSLLSLDDSDRVIHLTSLAKTIAPGLRCGAIVLPEALVPTIVDAAGDTYISPGQFAQATAMAYLRSGAFEPVIAGTRAALRERRDAALAVVREIDGVSWTVPAGGYFLWLNLDGRDAREVARRAALAGVRIEPGDAFFADARSDGHLRVAFCAAPAALVAEGMARLAHACRRITA